MRIQLCDCKFSSKVLYKFLREVDGLFMQPLSETLCANQSTLADYADKLSKNATIVYATDHDKIVGLIAGLCITHPTDVLTSHWLS